MCVKRSIADVIKEKQSGKGKGYDDDSSSPQIPPIPPS